MRRSERWAWVFIFDADKAVWWPGGGRWKWNVRELFEAMQSCKTATTSQQDRRLSVGMKQSGMGWSHRNNLTAKGRGEFGSHGNSHSWGPQPKAGSGRRWWGRPTRLAETCGNTRRRMPGVCSTGLGPQHRWDASKNTFLPQSMIWRRRLLMTPGVPCYPQWCCFLADTSRENNLQRKWLIRKEICRHPIRFKRILGQ